MATVTIRKPPPMRRGGYYWLRDPNLDKPIPFVSVTEVLNEIAKHKMFVPAAIRKAHAAWSEDPTISVEEAQATWYRNMKEKASIGSLLHSFYEAWAAGAPLDPADLPNEATRKHAVAFVDWFAAVKPEILHVEATVFNTALGYAGTGDLWCRIGDLVAIVDYKTGFLDEFSTGMQESAYQHGEFGMVQATGERFKLPEVQARYALQTRDNGTYNFVQLPDRWEDFKAYLHAWRARRRSEGVSAPCAEACFCGGGGV
jgi:hypothetical protein